MITIQSNIRNTVPDWLIACGSMTQHMKRASTQSFRVKLLAQTWQSPRLDEALLLSISKYSAAMVRETYLLCDEEVCMFARSLFPVNTLFGKGWQLQYLGEEPLGAVLFSDPKLCRSPFDFFLLEAGDQDYSKATAHLTTKPEVLWARRSVFYWHGKKIMLEEVFLPSLLDKVLDVKS